MSVYAFLENRDISMSAKDLNNVLKVLEPACVDKEKKEEEEEPNNKEAMELLKRVFDKGDMMTMWNVFRSAHRLALARVEHAKKRIREDPEHLRNWWRQYFEYELSYFFPEARCKFNLEEIMARLVEFPNVDVSEDCDRNGSFTNSMISFTLRVSKQKTQKVILQRIEDGHKYSDPSWEAHVDGKDMPWPDMDKKKRGFEIWEQIVSLLGLENETLNPDHYDVLRDPPKRYEDSGGEEEEEETPEVYPPNPEAAKRFDEKKREATVDLQNKRTKLM